MATKKVFSEVTAKSTPVDADLILLGNSEDLVSGEQKLVKSTKAQFEATIGITASQVSDFDTEVSNNTDVTANTAKISYNSTASTKLGTIETNADVTDTANVTSAGALMDSELTSIADVKALDQSVVSGASPVFATTNMTEGTDKNFVTDAEATVVGNTSGTNTGDQDLSGLQPLDSILTNTTASYTTADETKVDYLTVTQAVNLDDMETDIAALANGMVYKGDWDASVGTFPGSGSAQTGWFYYVSTGGTIDSVVFNIGDNIVATTDSASTGTYASNWSKHDQTDAVQSVVGLTGSVSKSGLLTAINVEDGADVTDTANVTAAGALMDSEVDADIKTLVLPASTTISTFGASLIDDTDASAVRATLEYATNLAGTTNTTSFTPTADYHPATKKYVDDNAGGGRGSSDRVLGEDISTGTPYFLGDGSEEVESVSDGVLSVGDSSDTLEIDLVTSSYEVLRSIEFEISKVGSPTSYSIYIVDDSEASTLIESGVTGVGTITRDCEVENASKLKIVSNAVDASNYYEVDVTLVYSPGSTGDLTPTMTSNTAPSGYTASASTEESGSRQAWRVFDKTTDMWGVTSGNSDNSWIKLQVPADFGLVTGYEIDHFNGTYRAVDFDLEGSDDGSAWTTIHSVTGNATVDYVSPSFTAVDYLYYRLSISDANSNSFLYIKEIRLMGYQLVVSDYIAGGSYKFGFDRLSKYKSVGGTSCREKFHGIEVGGGSTGATTSGQEVGVLDVGGSIDGAIYVQSGGSTLGETSSNVYVGYANKGILDIKVYKP